MSYIIYILIIIFTNNYNLTHYEWGGAPDQINWPSYKEK